MSEKEIGKSGTLVLDYYNYEVIIKILIKNGYKVTISLLEDNNVEINYTK